MVTKRKPKPISLTPEQIAQETAKQQARKRAARKTTKRQPVTQSPIETDEQRAARHHAEREALIAALRVDAEALGRDPDEYIAEQLGDTPEDPDQIDAADQTKKGRERTYFGPMLALVEARKHYVKTPNGQPCCGDNLSMILGTLKRERVVQVCLKALKLESNPYLHLNPGQQSMNLRNKLRAALAAGYVQLDDVSHITAMEE